MLPGWVALAQVLPSPSWGAVAKPLVIVNLTGIVAAYDVASTNAEALMKSR